MKKCKCIGVADIMINGLYIGEYYEYDFYKILNNTYFYILSIKTGNEIMRGYQEDFSYLFMDLYECRKEKINKLLNDNTEIK